MIRWLKDTCSKLPNSYANILLYDVLTGLRPDEACQSISPIHSDLEKYLNKDTLTLEHFRYPTIFIRRTKKAYFSILNDSILSLARGANNQGYNALRLMVKRRGLDMHMAYCRKIFATYLRQNGIEQEVIDLLQGRIPKSVFTRRYFRPDFDLEKIRSLIDGLACQIA